VLPALRKIYLDEIQDTPPPPVQPEAEVSRLRVENAILRAYCGTWKRRANLHSAVIHGIAKVAREQILSMRTDREQLEQKYQNLKRKYADFEATESTSLTSADDRFPKLSNEKHSRPKRSPSLPPKKKHCGPTRSSNIELESVD
jgi:hypothetical protein